MTERAIETLTKDFLEGTESPVHVGQVVNELDLRIAQLDTAKEELISFRDRIVEMVSDLNPELAKRLAREEGEAASTEKKK